MNTELAKQIMDAFYMADRIRSTALPPLPEGILPSHIHVLDALAALTREQESVRVSDISARMHLPRPGVTRTVQAMERKGLLRKRRDQRDGRVVHLQMTEKGEALYRRYVDVQFSSLSALLSGISDEDAAQMIRTISRIREALDRETGIDKEETPESTEKGGQKR